MDGTSQTLTYDSNGAITKYDEAGTNIDRYIQYNAANQPTQIVVGTGLNDSSPEAKDEFAYDPDGQRYARKITWQDNGTTKSESISYIGGVEYITYTGHDSLLSTYKTRVGNNIVHIKVTIVDVSSNSNSSSTSGSSNGNANGTPLGQSSPYDYGYSDTSSQYLVTTEHLEYAHRDHLGSIESVTDENGDRLMQLAFEPFGQRKDSDWTKKHRQH